MDLYLQGRIKSTPRHIESLNCGIKVVNAEATGDPLLDQALSHMINADLHEYTVYDCINSLDGGFGPLWTERTVRKMPNLVERACKYATEEGIFRMSGGGNWHFIKKPVLYTLVSANASSLLWEQVRIALRSRGQSLAVDESLLFLAGVLSILSLDPGMGEFFELREAIFWGFEERLCTEWGFSSGIPIAILNSMARKRIHLMS